MDIKAKLIGNEDERAVSPVIGVILMVAITVILAAVIAAFVLDLGGSIGEEAQAGVNIETSGDSIEATWTSQGNSDHIVINVEQSGDGESATDTLNSVGETVSWTNETDYDTGTDVTMGGTTGTVTAVAVTEEGAETVVQTESYDLDEDNS